MQEGGERAAHGSGGFMDGPESRLLSNTREEGEGASHWPAHSPSGAHLHLEDQTPVPHESPRALCDLAPAHLQLHVYVPSCSATEKLPSYVIA